MKTITYVKNFIKDKDIGSITPTSKFGIKKLCGKIDFKKDITLVEYGPGTGCFTEYILEKMSPDSRFILIEKNKNFYDILKNKISDDRVFIYNSSASDVCSIAGDLKIDHVDYTISGIPFSFFDENLKDNIISNTYDVLGKNGRFLVYQYSDSLKKCLARYFPVIETDFILFNIPPLYIIEATKRF